MTTVDISVFNNWITITSDERLYDIEKTASYVDIDFNFRKKALIDKYGTGGIIPQWIKDMDEMVKVYTMEHHTKGFIYNIPSGLLPIIMGLIEIDDNINISLYTTRFKTHSSQAHVLGIPTHLELREKQESAMSAIKNANFRGIVDAATGFGKTILGIKAVQDTKERTIILVDKIIIAQEWIKKFKEFMPHLHWYKKDSFYFATSIKHKTNKDAFENGSFLVAVATPTLIQKVLKERMYSMRRLESLSRDKGKTLALRNQIIKRWLKTQVNMLIYDEVHHAAADRSIEVLDGLDTIYKLGFSATPMKREDRRDLEYVSRIGSVIYTLKQTDIHEMESIPLTFIPVKPLVFSRTSNFRDIVYPEGIIYNDDRNDKIAGIIFDTFDRDRSALVLVDKIAHAQEIHLMTGFPYTYSKDKLRKEKFNNFMKRDPPILICTYQLAGEGYDNPMLDTVIMAGGGVSEIKVVQGMGRALRKEDGKKSPMIYDFADTSLKLRDQALKRLKIYINEKVYDIRHSNTFIKHYI